MKLANRPRRIFSWVACNLRLLLVKTIVLIIRPLPAKMSIITLAGRLAGLKAMISGRRQWPALVEGGTKVGGRTQGRDLVQKYYFEQEKSRIFSSLFYEAHQSLGKYVGLSGEKELRDAVCAGRGVILLGAHFGPYVAAVTLKEAGFDIKILISDTLLPEVERILSLGLNALMRKQWLFVKSCGCPRGRGFSERQLVRQIKSGGLIYMLIDFPMRGGAEGVDFFGQELAMSRFPFKLALNYGSPVFICSFEPAGGGYTLRLLPLKPFSRPEEGARHYADFWRSQITKWPYLWKPLPKLPGWFSGAADEE